METELTWRGGEGQRPEAVLKATPSDSRPAGLEGARLELHRPSAGGEQGHVVLGSELRFYCMLSTLS